MIPRVSLVTICHCTKLLLHYWLYSPLYISYLMTHLFCNWKLVPLINLPHLSHSSHIPLPSGNYRFVLCIYESASVFICLFTCYAFYSTYKWNHTVFVFQCLTPLSKIPSKSIHVVKMARFHSVLWLIVLSCSAVPDSCDPMDCSPPSSSIHGIFHAKILEWGKKKKNTGVGWHFLLQRIFPTQGSNLHLLCLLHWQAGSLPLALPGKPLIFFSLPL